MRAPWQPPPELVEPIGRLAAESGTPFFLFSERRIREVVETFRRRLAPVRHRIEYSVKTNREARVLRLLAAAGVGVEVTGDWELEWVGRCGFEPGRITLDGPIKSESLLEAGLAMGVSRVHVDSRRELETLSRLASRRGIVQPVLFRVAERARLAPSVAESAIGRFGFGPEEVLSVGRDLAAGRLPGVRLEGLSFFLGSQILSPRAFRGGMERIGRLVEALRRLGVEVAEVNAGGGFPTPGLVKTSAGNAARRLLGLRPGSVPPIDAYLDVLLEAHRDLSARLGVELALGVQPGRCLVGAAAVLVGRVREVKGRWVFLDASHDYLPETLLFAQREAAIVGEGAARPRRRVHLAGRTIAASDVFALGIAMPRPEVGDLVALADAGAYSLSRVSRSIALTPVAWWLAEDGRVEVLRRADTVDDAMATTVTGSS